MSKPMSLLQPSLPGEDAGHPFHASSSPSNPFGFALDGSQHQTPSSPLPVLTDLSLFDLLQHAMFFAYSLLVSDPLVGSSLRPIRPQHSSAECKATGSVLYGIQEEEWSNEAFNHTLQTLLIKIERKNTLSLSSSRSRRQVKFFVRFPAATSGRAPGEVSTDPSRSAGRRRPKCTGFIQGSDAHWAHKSHISTALIMVSSCFCRVQVSHA